MAPHRKETEILSCWFGGKPLNISAQIQLMLTKFIFLEVEGSFPKVLPQCEVTNHLKNNGKCTYSTTNTKFH